MTQRIFDIENEKDMQDLWNILPDDALKICKDVMGCQVWENRKEIGYTLEIIKINWHDKTEITRPIQEVTEQDIGKICVFYDGFDETDNEHDIYAVLYKIENQSKNTWFYTDGGDYYAHCRRLTKQEIEELC